MSLSSQFENAFGTRFRVLANAAEKIMKSEAPHDTGALSDAIKVERLSWFRYRVGVDSSQLANDGRNASGQDYSPFVINGHRGYHIYPVRAQALRWVGKDGRVHYAKHVYIPAKGPNDFVARTRARLPRL